MENDEKIRDGHEEGLDREITVLRSDVTSHRGSPNSAKVDKNKDILQ